MLKGRVCCCTAHQAGPVGQQGACLLFFFCQEAYQACKASSTPNRLILHKLQLNRCEVLKRVCLPAAAEVEEEQTCLDLADLILETAQLVDQRAHASSAAGATCMPSTPYSIITITC